MKRFRLSREAAANIREIWEFIAEDNVSAAGRVRQELYDAIRDLVKMPGKGHTREDLTDKPVRFWPVRSYLIVYRPDTKPMEIVAVIHGARDIPSLLRMI